MRNVIQVAGLTALFLFTSACENAPLLWQNLGQTGDGSSSSSPGSGGNTGGGNTGGPPIVGCMIPGYDNYDSSANAAGTCLCYPNRSFDGTACVDNPPPPPRFDNLVAGGNRTCAKTSDGKFYCWGDIDYKGLSGTGSINPHMPRPLIPLQSTAGAIPFFDNTRPINTISLGREHICALSQEQVYCWGKNSFGLGFSDSVFNSEIPTSIHSNDSIPIATPIRSVKSNGQTTCAASTSDIYCWGKGFSFLATLIYREISGTTGGISAAGDTELEYSVGNGHMCVATPGPYRELHCFGDLGGGPDSGQRGVQDGSAGSPWVASSYGSPPSPITSDTINSISLGYEHSCGNFYNRDTMGFDFWCWGSNHYGQLGIDDSNIPPGTAGIATPANESGFLLDVLQASSGESHTCTHASDGQIWCWGSYESDSGAGPTFFADTAIPIGANPPINPKHVTSGENHTCLLTQNGKVFCWGRGDEGQLGYTYSGDPNSNVVISHEVPIPLPSP